MGERLLTATRCPLGQELTTGRFWPRNAPPPPTRRPSPGNVVHHCVVHPLERTVGQRLTV